MTIRYMLSHVLGIALIGALFAVAAMGGEALAQTPTPPAAPVQPWGLPPLPAGVGPVEKFADVSGTPQGKFSKVARSIRRAICGSWRSVQGGFHPKSGSWSRIA